MNSAIRSSLFLANVLNKSFSSLALFRRCDSLKESKLWNFTLNRNQGCLISPKYLRPSVTSFKSYCNSVINNDKSAIVTSQGITTTTPESSTDEFDKLYSLIEIECRGHDTAVLKSYHQFVTMASKHLDITMEEVRWPTKPSHVPKHIQRWTLLKSVHIHKKHRVQYEVRTYFLVMKFHRLTSSTADTLLEYIQRNLPEGVSMKVTKNEIVKLPEFVEASSAVASSSS